MSANPTLYADTLSPSRSPSAVFHSISTRLSLSRALTADLATYYHERAVLEEAYVKGLKKLESRLLAGQGKEGVFREFEALAGGLEGGKKQAEQILGGGLTGVRKTLEGEVGEVAKVHEQWRKKISEEVERSLKDSLSGGEWVGWNRGEEQLRGQVKEYEGLVEKVQKAESKSTRSSKPSSKLLTSQSALSTLGSSLTHTLPSFLTQSQALDLSHSAFLKEALVRAGTASSDLGRERMEMGERVLVAVLGVDESADAEEWALREGMRLGGGGSGAARANGFGANGGGLASVGEFGETESVGSVPPPVGSGRTRQETGGAASSDAASTRSGSIAPSASASASASRADVERSRTISRPPPPAAPLPLPTSPTDNTDRHSTHTVESSRTGGGEKKKTGFGGKLSSILGGGNKSRDRSSSIPNSAKYANFASPPDAPPVPTVGVSSPSLAAPTTAPELDRRSSGGSDLLGGSSAGFGGAVPLQPEPMGTGAREKRKSFMPGSGGGGGGGLFRRQSKMSALNGGSGGNDFDSSAGPSSSSSAAAAVAQGSPSLGGGAPQFAQHLSAEPATGSPKVDSEGFSVPPDGYDRPITGASGGGNLMDDDDEPLESTSSTVPRLSIAPSLPTSSFSSAPASVVSQESESDRLAALRAVQSTLAAPPSSGLSRRGTARGRRSEGGAVVRNTVYGGVGGGSGSGSLEAPKEEEGLVRRGSVASDDDVPLAVVQQQQQQTHRRAPPPPPAAASSPPLSPASTFSSTPTTPSFASAIPIPVPAPAPASIEGGAGGRTMSILSTTSSLGSSSTTTAARPDPFAQETTPGLRAEVRETVNVLMKNGEAVRVMVAGEVGVSYRPPPGGGGGAETKEGVKVRFSGLEAAEKVAPNPAFLQPSSSSSSSAAGEYTLLLPALLSRTGGSGATTTVLKYQLALPTSSSAAVPPITVRPTWRCEPGLSRAIVAYSVNRDSALFQGTSSASPFGGGEEDDSASAGAKLEDVQVTLHLSPTSPVSISSFQSKPSSPVASLLPSSRGIVFALGSLSPSSEEKLLASLQTDPGQGAAVPGQCEVKWRVRGRTVGAVGVEMDVEGGAGVEGEQGLREVRRETVAGTYKAA